jgi:hypothetical protein
LQKFKEYIVPGGNFSLFIRLPNAKGTIKRNRGIMYIIEALGSDGSSDSIKVGRNGVTQTAKGVNGESVSRSVSR